jgi:hypothetical protein
MPRGRIFSILPHGLVSIALDWAIQTSRCNRVSFCPCRGILCYFFPFFFFPEPTAWRECVSASRRLRAVAISKSTLTASAAELAEVEPRAWSAFVMAGRSSFAVSTSSLAVTVPCVFVIVSPRLTS